MFVGDAEALLLRAYTTHKVIAHTALLITIGCTFFATTHAFFPPSAEDAISFLDVGQGDAALITLAPTISDDVPVHILVDGGRDGAAVHALDAALSTTRYIDVVLLSHADADHYGGLTRILEHYDVGAFISNGVAGEGDAWQALMQEITSRNIPHYVLAAGDRISYGDAQADILLPIAPTEQTRNEGSIVFMLSVPHATGTTTALFTGDIGKETEALLLAQDTVIDADIFKVPHHGSRHSSSAAFIHAVSPVISVISVGKNTYGHPAPETLDTLARSGSAIFTTTEDHTVRIPLDPAVPTRASAPKGFFASVFLASTEEATEATLADTSTEKMTLVPVNECSFSSPKGTRAMGAYINEVAWMGSATGTTHEWIELVVPMGTDISGWQLVNENGRMHATFPQGTIATQPYVLVARTAANDALSLNADLLVTGALRNSNEGLRLFSNTCELIDEIPVASSWPAGDAKTKRTMERLADGGFVDSLLPGGSPGEANGTGVSETESPSGEPYLFAEFGTYDDDTFSVSVTAEHLPENTYDLKVSLVEENGAEISETFSETENRWRASLYYIPNIISGTTYDGSIRLRRKETFATVYGTMTLRVRMREHGATKTLDYTTTVSVPKPVVKKEPKAEKATKTVAPATPSFTLSARHPDTITAATPFTVTLSAENLQSESYDVKASIEAGGILSRTLRDNTWSSSQFYLTNAFTGPQVSAFPIELLVPTSTTPLPTTAELIIRIRTGDTSGVVAFRAPITINTPTIATSTPEEESETETPDPEPTPTPACVNINTADATLLDTITQIGPSLAAKIIQERENSPFTSLDDLLRVSGIGPTTLEKIRTEGLACI